MNAAQKRSKLREWRGTGNRNLYRLIMKPLISHILFCLLQGCTAPSDTSVHQDSEYFNVAGALQHNPTTRQWEIVNDADHEPLNIDRFEVTADALTIYHKPASKVVSLSLDVDDTFSRNGYFVGASVGTDRMVLYFSKLDGGTVVPLSPNDTFVDGGEAILIFGIYKK